MGEEIDLTRYVAMLLRKWWLILLMAMLSVGAAIVGTAMLPSVYQASTLVATVRERTDVRFSAEIRTITENDLRPSVNDRQRMETFVTLVPNPLIAQEVIERLGDSLPQAYRNQATLLSMVSGSIVPNSDAIEITVRSADPNVPVALVNAWTETYVRVVNQTYGSLDQTTTQAVSSQVKQARATYVNAQSALEAVLQTSQVMRLQRDLDQYQLALSGLVQDNTLTLQRSLADRQRTIWLLRSAQDMRSQIAQSGDDALSISVQALSLLQAQVYGLDVPSFSEREALTFRQTAPETRDALPSATTKGGEQLQINLLAGEAGGDQPMTSDDILALLDGLVQALEQRSLDLDRDITTQLSANVDDGSKATQVLISDLEEAERNTRMLFSRESAALADATLRRDMARQAYEALARKETELAVSAETTGAQVRLALPAATPRLRQSSRVRTLGIAAFVGLVLGVLAALSSEFWQDYRRRQTIDPSVQA